MDHVLKETLKEILAEQLHPINQRLEKLETNMNGFQGEFKEFQKEIQGEFKEFKTEIQGEFKGFKEEVQGELKEFKEEVQGEFKEFKEEVHGEFKEFKEEVQAELKEFKAEVQADFEVLKGGQKGIRLELTDKFGELKKAIRILDSDIDYTYMKAAQTEKELNRQKSRIK